MPPEMKRPYKFGGGALVASGVLFAVLAFLDFRAGPPPSHGAEILLWRGAQALVLEFVSEILFFVTVLLNPHLSACRSNCLTDSDEWSCDGESAPHDSEAKVFGELERPDGVDDPVVSHGRRERECVADEQCPPGPAIATPEGRDRDSASQQPEHHAVDAVRPEKHDHVLGGHRRRA